MVNSLSILSLLSVIIMASLQTGGSSSLFSVAQAAEMSSPGLKTTHPFLKYSTNNHKPHGHKKIIRKKKKTIKKDNKKNTQH